MSYVEPKFVFKIGDQVQLRSEAMPTFRMFVVGSASYDEAGWGGAYARVFWLDIEGKPHSQVLPELILQIVEGAPSAPDIHVAD